jgi:integrase/recombinase XerD
VTLILRQGLKPHTNEIVWLMLDENYQVVVEIQPFLTSLSRSKSPNTVKAYGSDLKFWWEFLALKCLDWRTVNLLSALEEFSDWLRVGDSLNVVSMQPVAVRTETTVNRMTTAIESFYKYHIANGTIDLEIFARFNLSYRSKGKGSLAGIAKSQPTREKLIKLKVPKKFVGCLTNEEVTTLVNACHPDRDKLMVLMLNDTGLRKGELLGLCHEDIGDNNHCYIKVVKRDNPNGARVKGRERTIPVNLDVLKMYNDYLIHEYPNPVSNYVFVNIWEGDIGMPMNPNVLNTMFSRLSNKTGIKGVHPHLFRHTYATRMIELGCKPERLKYLLGHANIQTTLDTYYHPTAENLRKVIEKDKTK